MAVQKPYFLERFLDVLVFYFRVPPFNIDFFGVRLASRGDWMDWSMDVGGFIETALDALLIPINAAISLVGAGMVIWEAFWALRSEIMGIIADNIGLLSIRLTQEVSGLWDKLTGDFRQVWDTLSTIVVEVSTLIPRVASMIAVQVFNSMVDTRAWVIDEMASMARSILDPWKQVLNTVSLFVEDINDLFSDPEEWLYAKIDTMLDRFW